jgi:hypothetical protein
MGYRARRGCPRLAERLFTPKKTTPLGGSESFGGVPGLSLERRVIDVVGERDLAQSLAGGADCGDLS